MGNRQVRERAVLGVRPVLAVVVLHHALHDHGRGDHVQVRQLHGFGEARSPARVDEDDQRVPELGARGDAAPVEALVGIAAHGRRGRELGQRPLSFELVGNLEHCGRGETGLCGGLHGDGLAVGCAD